MNIKCLFCSEEFKVRRPSEINTRKYCSKKCQHNAQKVDKITISCKECGKEIKKLPCLIRKTNYCSVNCKILGCKKNKNPLFRKCWICGCNKSIEKFSNYKMNKSYRCKECECERSKKRQRTPEGRFAFAKSLAKRRKLEWVIQKQDYFQLIEQKCHYCNYKLDETGIGLDRKDSSKGYTNTNVVPCCKICNMVKNDYFTYEEMIKLLSKSIIEVKEKRFKMD